MQVSCQYHHWFWELWQFSFLREIDQKSGNRKYHHLSFAQYLETGRVRDTKLVRMSLMKCHGMLQNARVTAFTISELLRENQQGRVKITPPRLGVRYPLYI